MSVNYGSKIKCDGKPCCQLDLEIWIFLRGQLLQGGGGGGGGGCRYFFDGTYGDF